MILHAIHIHLDYYLLYEFIQNFLFHRVVLRFLNIFKTIHISTNLFRMKNFIQSIDFKLLLKECSLIHGIYFFVIYYLACFVLFLNFMKLIFIMIYLFLIVLYPLYCYHFNFLISLMILISISINSLYILNLIFILSQQVFPFNYWLSIILITFQLIILFIQYFPVTILQIQ